MLRIDPVLDRTVLIVHEKLKHTDDYGGAVMVYLWDNYVQYVEPLLTTLSRSHTSTG